MGDARLLAKKLSLENHHGVAIVAVDERTAPPTKHPQGAYFGRRWVDGAYTYQERT